MMHVNKNKCVGCGLCVDVCPRSAVSINAAVAKIDKEQCVECQACLHECPQQAITLIEDVAFLAAFGTDDGKTLKNGEHVGMSKYFSIYRFSDDGQEFIEQRNNVKYREDKAKTHGDPGKAKATASALQNVDVIVGQIFGPNITRLRNKFVCAVVRKDTIEQAIQVLRENIAEVIEERDKTDRMGIVLR